MSKFDLAVIGAGLGGLAAAARCAKLQNKTLLMVKGNEAGGASNPYTQDGYRFSADPALSFGFARTGAVQQLYRDLGISHEAGKVFTSYQVALPGHRITVFPEHSGTLDEIRREFPREIDRASQFYRDVKRNAERSAKSRLSSFFAAHKQSSAFLQRYRFSRELFSFFDIQARYFFRQPVTDIPLSTLMTLIDSSPLSMPYGFKKVADQLLDFFVANDGVVRFAEPFPELLQRRGRIAEIITSAGVIKTDAVVLNTRPPWFTTAYMGIKDQVVPVGMSNDVLCLTDYDRPQDLFSLSLSKRDDESFAPKGSRALTIRFHPLPFREGNASLLEHVRGIIPFVEDFCENVYAPAQDGMQYLTPDPLSIVESGITRQGERGTCKNRYIIYDEDGYPEPAVSATRRIVKRLT